MGLFVGKLASGFNSIISTVTTGVSAITQGVLAPLTNTAKEVLGAVGPIVKDTINSKAATALGSTLASVKGGKGLDAASIAALDSTQQTTGLSQGRLSSASVSDFFNYKNDDATLNIQKIAIHVGSLLTLGILFVVGHNKRWF